MTDFLTDASLIQLSIEADPGQHLERALGYVGPAQFVGWYASGDLLTHRSSAYCTDGAMTIRIPWKAYSSFISHPYVHRALRAYDLGGLGKPADYWLILSRETRHLYVAPPQHAGFLLQQQWPSFGKIEVFRFDSTGALVRVAEVPLLKVIEEQERSTPEQMVALEALRLWLEQQISRN